MKHYILTRMYYKAKQPTSDMHAATLYVTNDKAKLESKLAEEHANMKKFFKEVCDEEVPCTRNNMQMHPDLPYGYAYLGKEITGYLIVTYAENVNLPLKEEFAKYDLVKFAADANTYLRSQGSVLEGLFGCTLAQVLDVRNDKVLIRVLQTERTQYFGVEELVNRNILVKVTI